jgi:hypothetical protein
VKHVCIKHPTLWGCLAAAILFVALHVAVPAFTAWGIASHAGAHDGPHAAKQIFLPDGDIIDVNEALTAMPGREVHLLYEHDGVIVIYTTLERGPFSVCVIGIASGRMAKTVDVECK